MEWIRERHFEWIVRTLNLQRPKPGFRFKKVIASALMSWLAAHTLLEVIPGFFGLTDPKTV